MGHYEGKGPQKNHQGRVRRDSVRSLSPSVVGPQANAMTVVQPTARDPYSLTPAEVMRLQRMMGNQAVGRLFGVATAQPIQAEGEETADEEPVQKQKNYTELNDDSGFERKADVMGAETLGRAVASQVALVDVRSSSRSVVQREVYFCHGTGDGVNLSAQNAAKMKQVINDLNKMGKKKKKVDVYVTVTIKHGGGTNPAWTLRKGDDIEVDLQEWFIEMSGVGEILGLLVHEVGVHTLADVEMTKDEHEAEDRDKSKPFRVQVGTRTLTLAPTNNLNGRQEDHVNVAKDGGIEGKASARGQKYVETMLATGDAIWEDSGRTSAQKVVALRELLETFLFDMARIIATDDGGAMKVFRASEVIAHVFNWYQKVVKNRHQDKHAWLKHKKLQVHQSGWGIRGMLLRKVGDYITAQFNTSAIGKSWFGSVVRGAAWLAGGGVGLGLAAGALAGGVLGGTAGALGGAVLGSALGALWRFGR